LSRVRPVKTLPSHFAAPSLRPLWMVAVVVGLALQGLLPGLDLSFRGNLTAFGGPVCHSSAAGEPARAGFPAQDDTTGDHGCCLVCQAVPLAKGVPPSPTFTVPTAGMAPILYAEAASTRVDGRASRQHRARAPPIIAA